MGNYEMLIGLVKVPEANMYIRGTSPTKNLRG